MVKYYYFHHSIDKPFIVSLHYVTYTHASLRHSSAERQGEGTQSYVSGLWAVVVWRVKSIYICDVKRSVAVSSAIK